MSLLAVALRTAGRRPTPQRGTSARRWRRTLCRHQRCASSWLGRGRLRRGLLGRRGDLAGQLLGVARRRRWQLAVVSDHLAQLEAVVALGDVRLVHAVEVVEQLAHLLTRCLALAAAELPQRQGDADDRRQHRPQPRGNRVRVHAPLSSSSSSGSGIGSGGLTPRILETLAVSMLENLTAVATATPPSSETSWAVVISPCPSSPDSAPGRCPAPVRRSS